MERKIELRQVINILALFLIVQLGGMLITIAVILPAMAPVVIMSTSTQGGAVINVFWLILYLIIANVLVLLFFSRYKGDLLFRLLDLYIIIVPTFFLCLFILGSLFPTQADLYPVVIASFALGVALAAAKYKMPKLRNFSVVVASIGIGSVLGLILPFWGAYLLMMFIAVYDYIAVFVTKHMIVLAKAAVGRNLSLFIGSSDVEMIPKGYLSQKEQTEIKKTFKMKDIKNPAIKRYVEQGKLPVVSQVLLGGGDLGIPLMVAISAYATFLSFYLMSALVVGATLGLVFTMFILRNYKVPLPAIPPLFCMMSFALGVALVTTGVRNYQSLSVFLIGVLFMVPMYIALKQSPTYKS